MRCSLDALGGLTLFFSLLTITPTPSYADPAGSSWIGCYVDSADRVLSVWANGVNNYVSSMTNEMCASECSGYKYFGTEIGTYCFCGNQLIADAALAPTSTTCNSPCGGNDRETCGGAWLIDIYEFTAATAVTSPNPTPTGGSPNSAPSSSSGGSGSGNGNGNGNGNSNTQVVNVNKNSADSLSSPSKIAIGVTAPVVVLALAGFLW